MNAMTYRKSASSEIKADFVMTRDYVEEQKAKMTETQVSEDES